MEIISFFNNKGGVGKTSSCINLGLELAHRNHKVLLVDSDSQANMSSFFLKEYAPFSLRDIFFNGKKPEECIYKHSDNLFLIPSNLDMALVDLLISNVTFQREIVLKKYLYDFFSYFDFVIIDASPYFGLMNINVLCVLTGYIIPCQFEYFSLLGIKNIFELIGFVDKINPDLHFIGAVGSFFDSRKNLHHEIKEEFIKYFKDNFFKTIIRTDAKIPEYQSQQKSIFEENGKSIKSAADYKNFTSEFLEKIERKNEQKKNRN